MSIIRVLSRSSEFQTSKSESLIIYRVVEVETAGVISALRIELNLSWFVQPEFEVVVVVVLLSPPPR